MDYLKTLSVSLKINEYLSILEDKLKIQEDKWIERRSMDEMKQFRFGFRLDIV